MSKFAIERADVLTPTGWVKDACVVIENGKFLSIDNACSQKIPIIVAQGLLMLPGIVDIHGDAFERAIAFFVVLSSSKTFINIRLWKIAIIFN